MDQLALVRESALSDAYALLGLMLDMPTPALARGLATGSLLRDARSIAEEAGLGAEWGKAVDAYCASGAAPCRVGTDGEGADEGPDGALGEGFDEALDEVALSDFLHQLRVEHTRLFEHPVSPAVPLFEGQFIYQMQQRGRRKASAPAHRARFGAAEDEGLEGRAGGLRKEDFFDERPRLFVNDAALDAERCYRSAGLKRSAEKNVPADSMITELQFMAHLHAGKARALMEEGPDGAQPWDQLIGEFERIHLDKWAREFFCCVQAETRLEAYRLLGRLGAALFSR